MDYEMMCRRLAVALCLLACVACTGKTHSPQGPTLTSQPSGIPTKASTPEVTLTPYATSTPSPTGRIATPTQIPGVGPSTAAKRITGSNASSVGMIRMLELDHEVESLAFLPDSAYLVAGNYLWRIPGGNLVREFSYSEAPAFLSVAVSPDGKTVALGTFIGDILLFEVAGKLKGILKGIGGQIGRAHV